MNPQASPPTPARWWHDEPQTGRIVCTLCPRLCRLKPGDRGFCFVRQNLDGQMALTTYGKSTGFCIDPIEKKPLNHFHPGTSVLSFGTAGCNLGCQFCQNWDISKSREVARLSAQATPEAIAQAALDHGCKSVAFTYNDPVIWAEYAIDTARACHALGIKTVAVTAGYITPEARPSFFAEIDAANIDLKAFSEPFYRDITYAHLQPVLDTLIWLKSESSVWFEITNLLIPSANDDPDEIRRMCDWILTHLGPDVPLHFSAFHPDFRMRDRPPTPPETLATAHDIAHHAGLHYVYVGNIHDPARQNTNCPRCHTLLIERDGYQLGAYNLAGSHCPHCGLTIPGHFDPHPGTWGRRRQPIDLTPYQITEASHVPPRDDPPTPRPPAVAGRFYPADPAKLNKLVQRHLENAPALPPKPWSAALVPHAGLVYSGPVAAQVYSRLTFPPRILIIGPRHHPGGADWSLAPYSAWQIPGATIPADPDLARSLTAAIPGLVPDPIPHAPEHCIEVQLPYIARLAPHARVTGILIGSSTWSAALRFATGLASAIDALDEPPLLIISSDMNHFADDAENRRRDALAIAAMQSLDPRNLFETVRSHHISMCGAIPAVIVMETLRQLGRLHHCEEAAYTTSAPTSGDYTRVVGYAGLLFD